MCVGCSDDPVLAFRCDEGRGEHLRRLDLFESLSASQVAEVEARMALVELKTDQWINLQGDRADRFYLVLEGNIALLRQSASGDEVIVAIVGAGETFAEDLICLDDAFHPVSSRALDRCQLASFDRQHMASLLYGSPALVAKLMKTLHRRNLMLLDEIEDLALRSATERVTAYLLRQARKTATESRVSLSFPKRVLASRLSIKPETLSRVLTRLKDCSFIEMKGQEILLPQPQSLRDGFACATCVNRFWGCPGHRLHADMEDKSLVEDAAWVTAAAS